MGDHENVLAEARVPWPGPRPYDEKDWQDFCGRDPEIHELLDRVRVEKLTVLLGASGTGKTSLIRAGLVPMLRQERYHSQGDQSVWPVLLLRRWGAVSSASLEENLRLQLGWAIDAIQDWGKRLGQQRAEADSKHLRTDLESMGPASGGKASILEVVEELARAEARRTAEGKKLGKETDDFRNRGGLVLIFDQFEEQLRATPEAVSEALDLIGSLFRSKAPTRVLLSMRQEYRYALRRLELTVGGLSGRSFYLEPLKEPTVVEVVEESSGKSDIPIDRDVAQRMVRWLAPNSRNAPRKAAADVAEAARGTDPDFQNEGGRPDLLQLQAVLLELSRFALKRGQAQVKMALLDEFTAQFAEDGENAKQFIILTEKKDSKEIEDSEEQARAHRVLGGALERWIEAALRSESEASKDSSSSDAKSHSHADWAQMKSEDLRLEVHRIAIRLAPRLSSGEYKVSQEENALFRGALGEEIARLGIKAPELRSIARVVEDDKEKPPHLNWEELGLSKEFSSKAERRLSGLARILKWSPAETGNQIVICFKETLHRLARANILQCTSFGAEGRLYWELVHDQFGPNFMKWAERQRGTWDDCRSSLVVCSGLQPIAVPVTEIRPLAGMEYYDLNKITWQGCGIENLRSERLTLRNVRFLDCFLVGTIFDSIDFVGCSFENCDLKGGLFRNCGFRPGANGRPTRFIHCDSNIAIVGSVIELLEFRDCHLHQPAISDTQLEGEVRYTQGSRVIQAFYDVRKANVSRDVRMIFDASSRGCHCTATPVSFGYLDFVAEDPGMHNTRLPDDFRTRPWQSEHQE